MSPPAAIPILVCCTDIEKLLQLCKGSLSLLGLLRSDRRRLRGPDSSPRRPTFLILWRPRRIAAPHSVAASSGNRASGNHRVLFVFPLPAIDECDASKTLGMHGSRRVAATVIFAPGEVAAQKAAEKRSAAMRRLASPPSPRSGCFCGLFWCSVAHGCYERKAPGAPGVPGGAEQQQQQGPGWGIAKCVRARSAVVAAASEGPLELRVVSAPSSVS